MNDFAIVVVNEWNENLVVIGGFTTMEDTAEWAVNAAREPGNRGYTYQVHPIIPPAEFSNGEWKWKNDHQDTPA